jgi:hypothetical protein
LIRRATAGGAVYFASVFLIGAGLGTGRILLLEPGLGPVLATLVELPLMIGASWLVCGWVVKRLAVPGERSARLLMGGIAFLLLMAAELALTLFVFGGSIAGHFQAYRDPAPLIGLAGQLVFAALPLVEARVFPRRARNAPY